MLGDQIAVVQDDEQVARLDPIARLNLHLPHRRGDLAGNVRLPPWLNRADRRDRFFNRATFHPRQNSARYGRTVRPDFTRIDPGAKRPPLPNEDEPKSGQRQQPKKAGSRAKRSTTPKPAEATAVVPVAAGEITGADESPDDVPAAEAEVPPAKAKRGGSGKTTKK